MISRFLFPSDANPGAAATSQRVMAVWLLFFCLAMFLPGVSAMPVMDRDEARFALATQRMVQAADHPLQPGVAGAAGARWLQASAVRGTAALGLSAATTVTIGLYRIPSVAGAVATVLLTFWASLAFVPAPAAGLGALLLASTFLLNAEARLATPDALLAGAIAAAIGAMVRIRVTPRQQARRWRLAFWSAIAAAVIIGGPTAVVLPALAILSVVLVERSSDFMLRLEPVPGLLILVGATVLWLAAQGFSAGGVPSGAFPVLLRTMILVHGHALPPGAHLLSFIATGWPLSPFALLAAPFAWKTRSSLPVSCLLAWLIPAWLVLDVFPLRPIGGPLPLYVATTLLVSAALGKEEFGLDAPWQRRALWLSPAIGAAVMVAIALWARERNVLPGPAALLASPLIAWRLIHMLRQRDSRVVVTRILDASLLAWLVNFSVFAGISASSFGRGLMLSSLVAQARTTALDASGCGNISSATTSYREPSLAFEAGAPVERTDPQGAAHFLAGGTCRMVFVAQPEEKQFADALSNSAGAPSLFRVRGLDPATLSFRSLDIWTRGRGS